MKEKLKKLAALSAPMKLDAASNRWSRHTIANYTFEQPIGTLNHPVSRYRTPEQSVLSTPPGLPSAKDITTSPAGQKHHIAPSQIDQTAAGSARKKIDNRRIFNDNTYPWRCCGRVVTSSGHCTGALVGPRHLLTVSHVVDWNEVNDMAGWLRFEPAFYERDVFPPVYATEIYSYERITATSVDDHDVASDYVVCVLDAPIGNDLGWFGSKSYEPDWDDYTYWSHVGYPSDLGAGLRPFFEGPVLVKNSWRPGFLEKGYGRNILIDASTSSGDSGGPFFGWWDNGPSIVGVVCAAGKLTPVITHPIARNGIWVGGGEPLPSLIYQAITEHP